LARGRSELKGRVVQTEGRTALENDGEIYMVIAPDARHLRALRLVAADAGGRAGFDVSEVDDLRIAVDELCQAMMWATEYRLVVRVVVHGPSVVVRASARRRASDPVPRLSSISELIVDAVSDEYRFDHSDQEVSFVVSKTAGRANGR
jgi:hypothetical protein